MERWLLVEVVLLIVRKLMLYVNRGDAKLLFSAANDGIIIAWGSGGAVHDRIPVSY